jgi:hypothetical protein
MTFVAPLTTFVAERMRTLVPTTSESFPLTTFATKRTRTLAPTTREIVPLITFVVPLVTSVAGQTRSAVPTTRKILGQTRTLAEKIRSLVPQNRVPPWRTITLTILIRIVFQQTRTAAEKIREIVPQTGKVADPAREMVPRPTIQISVFQFFRISAFSHAEIHRPTPFSHLRSYQGDPPGASFSKEARPQQRIEPFLRDCARSAIFKPFAGVARPKQRKL